MTNLFGLRLVIFTIVNFFIGFLSDIILNVTNIVPSLKTYFEHRSILWSAFCAGLTIIFALFITYFISYNIFHFTMPVTINQLIRFTILTFVMGFIIDILIFKLNIFGKDMAIYYKKLGAGFWGAVAFSFSVVISYFIENIIHKFINNAKQRRNSEYKTGNPNNE